MQDAQGRIIAVGHSADVSGVSHMAIWRFNPDGSFDTSFNGTGGIFAPFVGNGPSGDEGRAVALDSQGRIVVAGTTDVTSSIDMVLWRYTADGNPDSSFNGGGNSLPTGGAAGGPFLDQPFSVKIDSVGRIVVLGDSLPTSADPWYAVWRYLDDGTPDGSFSDGACVTTIGTAGCLTWQGTISTYIDFGVGLAIDSQDRIVSTGTTCNNCASSHLVVWRYKARRHARHKLQ